MVDTDMLSAFEFFSDVPQEKLSAIAQKCDLLEFESGDVIFQRHEKADNLYGVLNGEVELSLIFKDEILKTDIEYEESVRTWTEILEKPIVIDRVGSGQIFGWSSLIYPGRWTATASCPVPARVFSLPASDLISILDQEASLGYLIMKRVSEIISRRLQNRTDKLVEAWGEAFGMDNI